MITHYDLFAGIGGFSLAIEEVFYDQKIKHIFCEWEQFPTAVLKKHWPGGVYWGDIAELVTHTASAGLQGGVQQPGQAFSSSEEKALAGHSDERDAFTILTGGFPCQPFSAAGRRKGTDDDRYKWPEMFAVIRNVKPDWIIAENVRGLATWNEGMVLEQVCTDLESEGYEVQPIIIPAVAVNAPHRRDRIWIIAHAESKRSVAEVGLERESKSEAAKPSSPDIATTDTAGDGQQRSGSSAPLQEGHRAGSAKGGELSGGFEGRDSIIADSGRERREPRGDESVRSESEEPRRSQHEYPDWERDWKEVAFATCDDAMVDGLPRWVDGLSVSYARWRKDSLKAFGNGIVPEVAMQIVSAIRVANEHE